MWNGRDIPCQSTLEPASPVLRAQIANWRAPPMRYALCHAIRAGAHPGGHLKRAEFGVSGHRLADGAGEAGSTEGSTAMQLHSYNLRRMPPTQHASERAGEQLRPHALLARLAR